MNHLDFLNLLKTNDKEGILGWLATGRNLHWLHEKNGRRCTPLMWACDNNHTDLAFKMLEAGAKADPSSISGWTSLAWAAWHGNEPLANRLLSGKCNVNAVTNDGLTPFLIAAQNGHQHLLAVLQTAGANVHHAANDQTSALHLASRYGRTDCVRTLLDMGLSTEKLDRYGNTPLMLSYDPQTAYELLDRGAEIESGNLEGRTALHHAALRWNHAVVDALLSRGANVDAVDHMEATPIALAFRLEPQEQGAENDLDDAQETDPTLQPQDNPRTLLGKFKLTIEALLDANPDLKAGFRDNANALMRSTEPFATQMLIAAGLDVNAKDQNLSTALMHCFLASSPEEKNIQVAETLIAAGANVNDVDRWGTTCLCMAGQAGKAKAVRMLVEEGAVDHWHDREGNGLCMHLSCMSIAHLEEILQAILPTVKDLDRTNEQGKTLLMLLAKNETGQTGGNVRRAIELGADPNILTGIGWTALCNACVADGKPSTRFSQDDVDVLPRPLNNLQIVNDLLEGGADPLVIDDQNNTLLHHAARTGSGELLSLLASLKIPSDLVNRDRKTAMELAVESQHYRGVEALMLAGASIVREDGQPVTKLLDLLANNNDQACMRIALATELYDLEVRMRVIGKCAVGAHTKSMVEVLEAAEPEERKSLRAFALEKVTRCGLPESQKDRVLHALRAHGARAAAHALLQECDMGGPSP